MFERKERSAGEYVEYVVFTLMVLIVVITLAVNLLGISVIGETPLRDKIVMGFATIILLFLPRILLKKIHMHLPALVLLFIEVFIFLGMYLGEIQYAFYTFLWWDIFLHFLSGVLLAIFGFLLIYPLYMHKPVPAYAYLILVFAVSFAVAAGGIWELIEYSIDQIFGTNMQRSGLPDTMGDIAIDTAGALVAGIAAYLYVLKRRHSKFFDDIARDYYEHNKHLFEVDEEDK